MNGEVASRLDVDETGRIARESLERNDENALGDANPRGRTSILRARPPSGRSRELASGQPTRARPYSSRGRPPLGGWLP